MKDTFVPEATGQIIDPAEVPGGLELLFGAHAEEVRQMLSKPRPVNRYVQIVKPCERVYRIMSEEQSDPEKTRPDFESEDTLRVREAAEAEREACARLVETATDAHDLHDIARRIRARKDKP